MIKSVLVTNYVCSICERKYIKKIKNCECEKYGNCGRCVKYHENGFCEDSESTSECNDRDSDYICDIGKFVSV